ncbi:acetyl-CoA carboxylase biotin carboxylase subunit family protein [Actinokineospora guangxiensis]|uniref:Acetyl-CoA carboxylase biotin carboxylase subunit family protein n=1 Tax=Actinokineospora guangxiensis TaxID=1490288 RepID=A0ABW0ESR7_9PSEU
MTRHIVVVHRWRAPYAEYERYVDHGRTSVTYVTTEVGRDGVPASAAGVELVAATDDLPAVRAAVLRLAARHGAPDGIVALKEDDLLVGAELRREWGCPGPTVAETVPFRDKLAMCTAVAEAGVAVPAFAPAPDRAAVLAFAAAHGWPVVVKPKASSSSAGVVVAHGPADVRAADVTPDCMVQKFQPGTIYQVDGVFDGSRVVTARASRYLQTCLEFRQGSVLGLVQEDDPRAQELLYSLTERAMRALAGKPTVFHLEAFLDGDACAFLEVGARTSGGEIPFLWREVHGYDLMAAGWAVALGEEPPEPPADLGDYTGELLAPAPARRPCRVLSVTSMLGTVPCLYAEDLVQPGEVLPDADAYYEHVGGRFRFRGTSSAEIAAAVDAVAAAYRVTAEPLSSAA